MNFVDIILVILIAICIIAGLILLIIGVKDDEIGAGIGAFLLSIALATFFFCFFFVIDKKSGNTIGTITSVDKNFFGTTALYIKTTETNEEEYCIEFNEELEQFAKDNIGKKVKISYGERVGLYSTGKCSEAPIERIELIEEQNE